MRLQDIFHLIDIACCCAILFPIVWQMKVWTGHPYSNGLSRPLRPPGRFCAWHLEVHARAFKRERSCALPMRYVRLVHTSPRPCPCPPPRRPRLCSTCASRPRWTARRRAVWPSCACSAPSTSPWWPTSTSRASWSTCCATLWHTSARGPWRAASSADAPARLLGWLRTPGAVGWLCGLHIRACMQARFMRWSCQPACDARVRPPAARWRHSPACAGGRPQIAAAVASLPPLIIHPRRTTPPQVRLDHGRRQRGGGARVLRLGRRQLQARPREPLHAHQPGGHRAGDSLLGGRTPHLARSCTRRQCWLQRNGSAGSGLHRGGPLNGAVPGAAAVGESGGIGTAGEPVADAQESVALQKCWPPELEHCHLRSSSSCLFGRPLLPCGLCACRARLCAVVGKPPLRCFSAGPLPLPVRVPHPVLVLPGFQSSGVSGVCACNGWLGGSARCVFWHAHTHLRVTCELGSALCCAGEGRPVLCSCMAAYIPSECLL